MALFFLDFCVHIGSELMDKLRGFAREVSEREGCLLYDVEFTGGGQGRVLRVFIDKPDGSVTIDDCSNVSRGLNLLLDVEDIIPGGRYDLEVSSPGLERKLTQPWHFQRVIGQKARIRMREPLASVQGGAALKTVTGLVEKVDENCIVIKDQQQEWRLDMSQIEKAQVVFEPPSTSAKKGKGKKR